MLSLTELSWYDKNGKLQNILDFVYPVGSIYMTTNSQNPSTLFGGEWVAWGQGRVPVGFGTGKDSNGVSKTFSSIEGTGGEYNHTLSNEEMPKHYHPGTLLEYHETLKETSESKYTEANTKMVSKNNSIYSKIGKMHEDYLKTPGNIFPFVKAGTDFRAGNNGKNKDVLYSIDGMINGDGNDEPHNNIQPYITCYMWKRTA